MSLTEAAVLEILNKYEPRGMRTQADIVWESGFGSTIIDINGKHYIDFSSGVMIANAGYHCEPIELAIIESVKKGLLTSYLFPNSPKAQLLKELAECIPDQYKIALFSTGAETTEAAIKIARLWGKKHKPHARNMIASFHNAFHGRTMGALCVGGIPALREWLPEGFHDPLSIQIPFPDSFYSKSNEFSFFLESLKEKKISANDLTAVLIECYQGVIGSMVPDAYMQQLASWCKENNILLIIDEIQSGCGRTGKFWAYEHYSVQPDIILAGKGLSSSLPLAAVIARPDVIDVCEPGTLNTTHSGNLICCAAGAANLKFIKEKNLVEYVAKIGKIFAENLQHLAEKFPHKIRKVFSVGMVATIHTGNKLTNLADPDGAKKLVAQCVQRGLMMYSPGGPEGSTVKLAPPLIMTEAELIKGCTLLKTALEEC